ncbi:RNA-binding protein 48-like [Anopheles merus]|uniref:RNA-binding protein 48-like n=1 Tax=Anopheles merus TaxID=30066 RepID=UPI001BE3DB92|nr:RNA-binding protein 48-like [Anopheles merus]XP_041786496.1 RNA-binding protein 48-like [Anopheles merus]
MTKHLTAGKRALANVNKPRIPQLHARISSLPHSRVLIRRPIAPPLLPFANSMSGTSKPTNPPPDSHHLRFQYCQNRPLYRRSRQLTAVRVYSVANESRHLLIFGVPQINLLQELRQELVRFGAVESISNITDSWQREHEGSDELQPEPFTDVFHACFVKLEKARQAKKLLDARNFYGGILHLSYAPERESVEEVRAKLNQRRSEVRFRAKLAGERRSSNSKQRTSNLPGVGAAGLRQ